LIGATNLAAQHAVWTLLYEIGYRQFFPTETWEVIPDKPNLNVNFSSFESPDFYNRNGPRLAAYTDREQWHRWHDRNRVTSSFNVATGHAYSQIISRNQEEFDANPEYTAGNSSKFRVSEPGLIELVVQDAVNRVKSNPNRLSVSMEPSDGGGWCDSPEEQAMGSITDRVVYLANAVAEAINDLGYGEKYVGIYAYNQHSSPPNIEVHPNVIVSVATRYNFSGYSASDLMQAWSERGAMIGIRDYYDTFVWHQGMPQRGPGGDVNAVARMIPSYYERGGRFMNANSTDAWAVNGLGFYLSTRLLWDVSLSENVDEIIEDFLEKAFGEAKEPARKFYQLVGRGREIPRTNSDLLAHMYTYLKEARELAIDSNVRARIDELTLYTRYVELWFNFQNAQTQSARDGAAQNVFRHAYRMQSKMLSPIAHLYAHLRRSDVAVDIPREVDPGHVSVGRTLVDHAPWKSSQLFSDEEIAGFIKNGLQKYEKEQLDFDIVNFSDDLVPAVSGLDLPSVNTGSFGRGFRGRKNMFTWLQADEPLKLEVQGGTISHYQNRGNVRFHLMSDKEVTTEPVDFDDSVPPDGEWYQIELTTPYDGLHELIWHDGWDRTNVRWDEGHHMTARASLNNPFTFQRDYRLYFYVPEGTKVVGGYINHHITTRIWDGDGNEIDGWRNEDDNVGYFSIPVKEGQDGSLWRIGTTPGNPTLRLLTVPPYLARNEQELLLPREVVEGSKASNADILDDIPSSFDLKQNYPNPFNPTTQIQFTVPNQTHVRLEVYNIIGQLVTTLVNEEKTPGRYEVKFDAATLASGVYLYRLQTDMFKKTRQMLLVK